MGPLRGICIGGDSFWRARCNLFIVFCHNLSPRVSNETEVLNVFIRSSIVSGVRRSPEADFHLTDCYPLRGIIRYPMTNWGSWHYKEWASWSFDGVSNRLPQSIQQVTCPASSCHEDATSPAQSFSQSQLTVPGSPSLDFLDEGN